MSDTPMPTVVSAAPIVSDDQEQTIAFLSDPRSYPELSLAVGQRSGQPDDPPVLKIQTHGALVFLAGQDAFKIKRAVRYPYMDFSTLLNREQACRREFEVNHPAAPQIYHGVVAITRTPAGMLEFGGAGPVVEWAVHMRRFDQHALLERLAIEDKLSVELADDVARAVLQYHGQAPQIIQSGAASRIERLVHSLVSHFSLADEPQGSPHATFCELIKQTSPNVLELIEQRGQGGFVVRGHGDLHLANVVVLDGQPLMFDALEFDEDIATVDVLHDLAFLIMDLEVYGLQEQANRVLNRYLHDAHAIENYDALRALPVYLALRAAVRSMVETERQRLFFEDPRPQSLSMASNYIEYANRALQPAPPSLIAIGGLSGTGKTTVARSLAPLVGARPGALHIRSDIERKTFHGVAETTRLPDTSYTLKASQQIYAIMLGKAQRALEAGHSVVLDAVFLSPEERAAAQRLARRCDVPFSGIWLNATMNRLHQRVSGRRNDASDASVDVVRRQLDAALGEMHWTQVDANGTAEQTVATVQSLTCH